MRTAVKQLVPPRRGNFTFEIYRRLELSRIWPNTWALPKAQWKRGCIGRVNVYAPNWPPWTLSKRM